MSRKAAVLRRSDGEQGGPANHGPGPRLRDGRLARSMTLEEAAELLKLDPSVLASLERDDFTALPETLYVRGYLTSYARLLGIPEQEVVRDYLAFTGGTSAPTLTARRPIEGQTASSDTGLRWFSYGLMIGIVALVGWWGYQRLLLESPDSTLTASVEPEPAPVEQPPPESSVSSLVEPKMPPEIELPAQPPPDVSETGHVEVAAYTALPEDGEPAAAVTEPVSSPSEVTDGSVVPESETPATPVSVADDTVPASAQLDLNTSLMPEVSTVGDDERPPDILHLSFTRDCWVEIRDARQERLVYGLAKEGSTRRVEGEAPFQILLGDSNAVEIQFNGEATARSRYDSGDGKPARFSLGEAALETASTP